MKIDGATVPARIWQGESEDGIPCHAYITRIVPEIREGHPLIDQLTARFEAELQRCAEPTLTVDAIPLRMIL